MKYTSCFIGIPLPDEFMVKYKELADEVKAIFPNIRLADTDTPHITIYYLDKKSQNDLNQIANIVDESKSILRDSSITLSGMGAFGGENPKVLYLNVSFEPSLADFKDELVDKLRNYGAYDNDLGFVPHVTIGRIPVESRESFLAVAEQLEAILNKVNWSFEIKTLSIFGVDSRVEPESQTRQIDIKIT